MSLKFMYIITKFHGRRLKEGAKRKVHYQLLDLYIVSHTGAHQLISNRCI